MIQQWCKRVGQQLRWIGWRLRLWMAGRRQRSPWRVRPVSMRRFLTDPQYMGLAAQDLRPRVRRALIRAFRQSGCQMRVRGSVGSGKTTFLKFATCYLIYVYSCLWDPQRTLGIHPESQILLPLVAHNLVMAQRILLKPLAHLLRSSPYFRVWCHPVYHAEEIRLPGGLVVLCCSIGTERLLGTNVLSVVLDESFWKEGIRSETAQRIYESLLSRTVATAYGQNFPPWLHLIKVQPQVDGDTTRWKHWSDIVVDLDA